MAYRKLSASQLFTGHQLLQDNKVLVVDDNGTVVEIIAIENAGDGVELFEGIICPGFINAHCHIELSHLKNKIPEHTGLVNFVQQVMQLRNTSMEEKQTAMFQAESAMYNSGIVAVGDICNTTDSIPLKKQSKLYWHNFIEATGFIPTAANNRFLEIQNIANQYSINNLQYSINPHAPYSVSKNLFSLINQLPNNNLISIHNQESKEEDLFFKNKTGSFLTLYENLGIDISFFEAVNKSSLQTWLNYFTNNQKIIAVHNTFTSKEDVQFLHSTFATQHFTFCLCPNANLYISNELPNVNLLIESGCNIALGTDSLASNHQLSILEEIKTLEKHFANISIKQLLQWATINGAKALGIDNTFGSFEKGKHPGIVLVENNFSAVKRII